MEYDFLIKFHRFYKVTYRFELFGAVILVYQCLYSAGQSVGLAVAACFLYSSYELIGAVDSVSACIDIDW